MELGILSKHADGYQFVLEKTFNHGIEKVWDAITNPDKMSKWFTDVKMNFTEGGKIIFIFQDDDRSESYGKILTIRPPRLFEFLWEGEGVPSEHASWELFEEGIDKTRLVLTYSRVSEDYAASVAAGWHDTVEYLSEMLDGRTDFPDFGGSEPTERGQALKAKYEQVFNELK